MPARTMARRIPETESVRRRRRQKGGPPQFYVAPVGEVPSDPEARLPVPDLLHATPLPWGDLSGSVELTRYAFEGGDSAGVFEALVEALPLAETSFSPATFASQLYLDQLVTSAFALRGVGEPSLQPNARLLQHVLSHPPKDPAHRAVRQAVLRELEAKPALREALVRYYESIRRLRTALEVEAAEEPSLVRRKIQVLVALIAAGNALADLQGAESALSRLFELGRAMRARPAWDRLVRLVDLEGNVASVDLRLTLGADGTVRGFSIEKVRERDEARLLPGPFIRFLQQFIAFFRGHRYGESEVVVRLFDQVFTPLAEDVVAMLATTGAVELYLGALAFADRARERGLPVCLPEVRPASVDPSRHIEGLFNPLLFLQDGKVCSCDLPGARSDALTVITGPNSGGKTRLLQAVALTQLLGQAGVFVPASRAELVEAPSLFLSLVTDNDAGQIEGRLGTELTRIRQLFEALSPGSMAILDELCSGTNPDEGEEIFTTVISTLPKLRPQLFVSTHFLGLAARLMHEPPVETLSFLRVELDLEEKPTYRFIPGVASTSLAHKVAERLGVTQKDLEALVAKKLGRS
jgi:DNA mismatch repair protein MutS2